MAFFALLWKARTIEKYRLNYEKEKINSIVMGHTQMEQTLSQRWRHYRYDTKKRISTTFRRWYPEGSGVANFFIYLKTDQTFPNFLLKSVMGFVGGIVLTYLCFMFFVFQLSISLIHATIMSSIIGVLLTLGLAFSYRIRCLVFLLIPQFFSRVGRYTLTCYALVLILTGPATNTLKNSEVLSESMACSQEQIKTSVHQLNDLMKKPYNAMKDSIKLMVDRLKMITMKVKETMVSIDRLVLSLVSFIQTSFYWLQSVADICNAKLGTPYDRCNSALQDGIANCEKTYGQDISIICDLTEMAQTACYSVKPFTGFCYVSEFMDEAILAGIKKKLKNFTEHLRAMFHVEVHIHHSYSFSSNTSRSASQVTAGIVTEIRNRADPLLTWLSWSSCVTSLFLLLIIFRAKYYQHMYETRSRFDNRYVTKELQELDLKRQRQGRETVLPLNRRERAKYITTTSFRLVASEKVYLNRSAVFMAITTFKLLIHMVADYSLYWVLMTIRFHGRYQSDLMPGIPHSGVHVSGDGFAARLFRSIVETLDIPLASPAPSPISCLPDPYPPDLRRYTQIGVLIFLLWFFALFEPYGLRLRHLIMGHYRPERAKARATWLYNHILRTRAGFMKFARRKLHREYKYSSEASNTFRQWMTDHIPFRCLRFILGYGPTKPHCLLCGTTRCDGDPDTQLTRCQTPGCPGIFCISCFTDIGQLCTICLTPVDYGDFSDVSLEKGSSDDSDGEGGMMEDKATHNEHTALFQNQESNCPSRTNKNGSQRWRYFTRTGPIQQYETFAYKQIINNYNGDLFTAYFKSQLRKIKSNMLHLHHWDKKYTKSWVSKLTSENSYIDLITYEDNNDFYSNTLDIEPYVEFEDAFKKTRSIGMNTDKNRGIILNTLIKSFTRLKTKRPHVNKQRRVKSDLFQVKTVHYEKIVKSKEYGSIKSNGGILDRYVVNPQQNYTILTKTFHTHNLKTCQKNLLRIIGCDKDYDKIYTDVKGTLKAMKYFTKNNEITNITNQNNETAPNNPPAQNKDETNKPSDNTKKEGKKNKKKTSKINKPRKPKKQKDCNKVKNPNSPHKMSEFHTFFSNHWNHFKCTMMPCATRNRSDSPMTKEKKNHKRRKKRKAGTDVKETDKEKSFAKKDIRHTRNLRISAFLAELEWSKRDYKKVKDYEGNDGSFFPTDGLQAPRNANKIVGMVRLKNLPFQWREVPKPSVQTCDCKDEKCTCHNKTSDKELKLLEPTTSKPENAKKALERFRNKINSADTSPSSLVQKVMKSLKAEDHKSPPHDSSICISKRASGFKTIAQDPSESRLMDTNIIFKNENYLEDLQNPSHSAKEESSKLALCQNLVGKELIVSRSSKCRKLKCRASKKCKCDIYEDIQRKWAHVRKNFSNKGMKYPLSIMKNICSSLFGQSCTIDSCPNRSSKSKAKRLAKEKKECQKAKEKAEKLAKAKAKKNKKDLQAGTQTMPEPKKCMEPVAVQTCSRKDAEIQKMSGSSIPPQEVIIKNKPQEVLPSECKLEFKEKIIECKPKPAECKNEKVKCKGSPTGSRNEEILKFGREEYERQAIEREEDLIAEKLEKERLAMERSLKRLAELEKKKFEVDPCIKDSQTLIECEEKELLKFLDFNKSKSQVQFNSVPCSGQCSVLECTEKQQKKCQKPVQTPKETLNKGICAAPEKQDTGQKYQCLFMRIAQTGLSSTTEFNGLVPGFSTCQPRDCPNSCNAFVQYNKNDVCCDSSYDKKDVCTESYDKNDLCNRSYDKNDTYCTRSYDKNDVCHKYCDRTVATCNNKALENTKAVGSSKCLCDKALQVELKHTCTCATQHVFSAKNTGTIKPSEPDIRSFMVDASTRSMVSKGTLCSTGTRNIFEKKKKDGTSLGNSKRRKLSLENSLCVIDRKQTVSDALQEVLTDTITDDTSFSSLSISDDTKTDTTICSLATFDYDDHPRRRKFRVKVVTKTNQATLTDKTRLCDTGTVTSDWWSPIVERKCYDEILLEKKTGYNTIEKQKKELRELKEWKELREVRKRRKTCGVTTDGRIVTFRSRTQIIPTGFLPTTKDIMSPSRYLLESQKYYNELFSYNFRPPAQANFCVNQVPKYHEREKVRSPLGSRRNHHRKTKRLDECYSPRRQLSPRKRYTDSTKTAESPHRRSGYRADGHRLYNSSRTTDDDNITARNIFFEQQGHVCSGQSVIHGRILLENFFS